MRKRLTPGMKFLVSMTLLLSFANSTILKAKSDNPLIPEFNQCLDFDQLTAEDITRAKDMTMETVRTGIKKIANISKDNRTFNNTMKALDNLYSHLMIVNRIVDLLANTHPDLGVRRACDEANIDLGKFTNELKMNEELHQAVKAYSETKEAKNLTGYQKKFLDEELRDFRRNGLELPKEEKDKLKALQDELTEKKNTFLNNIRDHQDSLIVTERDMKGLPEDFKNVRRRPDGTYKIDLSYPSFFPFLRFSESDQARKELLHKFLNIAADKNLDIFDDILRLRQEIVKLLGYDTHAQYKLETRMAKTPQAVWDFEFKLIEKLKVKAKRDYQELLYAKQKYKNDENIQILEPWDTGFYKTQLLRTKYNVNPEEVKQYFQLNNVLDGLFLITQTLFDIKFEQFDDAPVWHKDVRVFKVYQENEPIGYFYLDLYPRANKFNHAAIFPMIMGHSTEKGYQLPFSAMVCNFDRPTDEVPSLLPHSDVETFFHEFGHLLHEILTKSPLSSFAGTNVLLDFVEMPSQILENWTWNYEALKLFAKHYKTGEVLPKSLFDKMFAAKNVNSGNSNLGQVFYGVLDMTYHDKYNPDNPPNTTEILKKLKNEITLFPYMEGTHLQAGFSHLAGGYSAGYYSYLWALVYAQDMFSVFEENGILDKTTGIRLRNTVLSKGATEDPMTLVKDFLNRTPDQNAFLRSIGLDVD